MFVRVSLSEWLLEVVMYVKQKVQFSCTEPENGVNFSHYLVRTLQLRMPRVSHWERLRIGECCHWFSLILSGNSLFHIFIDHVFGLLPRWSISFAVVRMLHGSFFCRFYSHSKSRWKPWVVNNSYGIYPLRMAGEAVLRTFFAVNFFLFSSRFLERWSFFEPIIDCLLIGS